MDNVKLSNLKGSASLLGTFVGIKCVVLAVCLNQLIEAFDKGYGMHF